MRRRALIINTFPSSNLQQQPNNNANNDSYVANTLSQGLKKSVPQDAVIAVSAMEAIGVSQALERYYAKVAPGTARVPFTNVRGNANQAVQPVKRADGSTTEWVDGTEVPADFVNGYKYAIESSASVVLSALQARCRLANASSKKGGSSSTCTYTVSGGARKSF